MSKVRLGSTGDDAVFSLGSRSVPPSSYDIWQREAKDDGIRSKDPDVILRFDDPSREGDAHAHLLSTIRMSIELKVLANRIVSESLVSLCELNVVSFDCLFGLICAQLNLVWMELDAQSLVVLLDLFFRCRSCDAQDGKGIIDAVLGVLCCVGYQLDQVGCDGPANEDDDRLLADLDPWIESLDARDLLPSSIEPALATSSLGRRGEQ